MPLRRKLLLATAATGVAVSALPAWADDAATAVEEVLVTARRDNRVSKGATGLDLRLTETPQAVTVVDREFMDTFGLDEANQVLALTTGVNVDAVETERTYYNARGFDIKSMQVDGVGLPFTWNVVGALDTAGYEKIEVVRGANGLLTGTGNPSGTINYVRKRPSNAFEGQLELTLGSWDRRRLEADVSGPFSPSGLWAGRLVAAVEEKDSHLDLHHNERVFLYGVVEGQIGERAILTAGYTHQDNRSNGVLWGALPLLFTDGLETRYEPSTSTSMNWTFWDTHSRTGFAELTYAITPEWEAKAVLTYNDYNEPSELFYVYGNPDPVTGLGLYGWPGKYDLNANSTLLDLSVTGPFALGGRRHELLLGVSLSKTQSGYLDAAPGPDDPSWGALPPFPGWRGDEIGRPAYGPPVQAANWTNRFDRIFGAAHLDLTDALDMVVGFNAIDVSTDGISFGESMARDEQAVSPYVGATWRLTPQLSAYASYSDIFEPQPELNANLQPLGAAVGESYEAGLKGEWFGGRLYTSASLFKAEQDNYAERAGTTDSGIAFYRGVDTRSEGLELEAAGRLGERLFVQGGFTQIEVTGEDGADVRTFIPRRTLVLAGTYDVPALPGLELGATLRWQDDIHLQTSLGEIRQDSYAVVSLVASYDLNERIEAVLRLNNVSDEIYLTSLYWDQAFYAPPRNVSVSLRYRF